MFCSSIRKRPTPDLLRGNGGQGCHFHGKFLDLEARDNAGLGQQRRLMHAQLGCPDWGSSQKDKPSGADVGQSTLAAQRIR